jgi:probable F420-dependent oxidoreductase
MDVGLNMSISTSSIDIAEIAAKAESLGFESIWLPEHPVMPVNSQSRYPGSADGSIPDYMSDMADPYIGLARASAVTSTIKLGTGISLIPERNPLVLAGAISTLDRFSGGRFLLGIGTGWLREETEIMGGNFDHRWTQAREAVLALKELWTKEEAEYHGRYYDFPPVYMYPKPFQKPHPPVLLGGNAPNVLQRVVRYADGWLPNRISPDRVEEARKVLDALADERGRDPASVTISVFGQAPDTTREQVDSFLNAGALRVSVWANHCDTEAEMGDQLEGMAESLIR